MRQKSLVKNDMAERTVRDIRRKTRKWYSAEEKIGVVVSDLRGEGGCHINRVTCCCWGSNVAGGKKSPMPGTDFHPW